jgi:hypothetical protein
VRCASAGAERPEGGLCVGPVVRVTPQAKRRRSSVIAAPPIFASPPSVLRVLLLPVFLASAVACPPGRSARLSFSQYTQDEALCLVVDSFSAADAAPAAQVRRIGTRVYLRRCVEQSEPRRFSNKDLVDHWMVTGPRGEHVTTRHWISGLCLASNTSSMILEDCDAPKRAGKEPSRQ